MSDEPRLQSVPFPVDVRQDVGAGGLELPQIMWLTGGGIVTVLWILFVGITVIGAVGVLVILGAAAFFALGGPGAVWRRLRYGLGADEMRADPLVLARAARGLSALLEIRALHGPYIEYDGRVWGLVLSLVPRPWAGLPEAARIQLLARLERVVSDMAAMNITMDFIQDARPDYIRDEVERLTRIADAHRRAGNGALAERAEIRRDWFAARAAGAVGGRDRQPTDPALMVRLTARVADVKQTGVVARLRGGGVRSVTTPEAAKAHLSHAAGIIQSALAPFLSSACLLGTEALRDEFLWEFEPVARERALAVSPERERERAAAVERAAEAWEEAERLPARAALLAIWSPVKGAGTSTAAANLAAALARRGVAVSLVDASDSDTAALLGIRPGMESRAAAHGVAVFGGPPWHRVGPAPLPDAEDGNGWAAFLGPDGPPAADADAVVMDLPCGGSRAVAGLSAARLVLPVLPPDSGGMDAARSMLAWLARANPGCGAMPLLREGLDGRAADWGAPAARIPSDPAGYRRAAETGSPYAAQGGTVWDLAAAAVLGNKEGA